MMLHVTLPCILCANLTKKMCKLVWSFFILRNVFKQVVQVSPGL